jgi:Protein of unknown function DUF262
MDDETSIKPLIPESSTSESTAVEVIMNDLRDKFVQIPDYQRDSDQWAEPTKSLLIESVINNLSIPAFFFEVSVEGGVEHNQVIDGQQRLTRACPQLRRMIAETSWTAARKFRASLS